MIETLLSALSLIFLSVFVLNKQVSIKHIFVNGEVKLVEYLISINFSFVTYLLLFTFSMFLGAVSNPEVDVLDLAGIRGCAVPYKLTHVYVSRLTR